MGTTFLSLESQTASDFVVLYSIDFHSPRSTKPIDQIMSGSYALLSIKGNKSYFEVTVDSILGTTFVYDGDLERGLMLLHKYDLYYATPLTREQAGSYLPAPEFVIDETIEEKEIAGYKCRKVVVEHDGISSTYWVTSALRPACCNSVWAYPGLNGFPLEVHEQQGATTASYYADTVALMPAHQSRFSVDPAPNDILVSYEDYVAGNFPEPKRRKRKNH